jgi:phosphoesterase RecJ-like protein
MMLGLESLGKRVDAISSDGVPELYRFLPGWERVVTTAVGPWDAAIGMDADGADRLGPAAELILAQAVVINLDHHTSKVPYGDVQVVDRTAAATGELVFQVLDAVGAPLTQPIAECLMAAILTDTGSFRYSNVSAETFRIGAALREAGALPGPVYETIYGTRPFAASRLLGRFLSSLQRSADGRVAWASISLADFQEFGVGPEATEGFVDQVRMVEGAEVAIYFREEPDGLIRVSLRSRGEFNVARIAEKFGGGGHIPAAGCTLPGPLAKAICQVTEAIRCASEDGMQ